MTYKTRKRIWPPALMSLVIVGALAVVLALSVGGPQSASAHDCEEITDPIEQAKCVTVHANEGEDHDQEPDNQAPVTSMAVLDPVTIEGVMVEDADGNDVYNTHTVSGVTGYFSDPDDDDLTFTVGSSDTSVATAMIDDDGNLVITVHDAGDATITITATDEDGAEVSSTVMVEVQLSPAERYTIAPAAYEFDAPTSRQVTFTVSAVDADNTPLDEDATVNFVMTQYPADTSTEPLVTRLIGWDSSTDSDIEDDDILQGLLTVRATDPDGERGFTVYFRCFAPGERVEIDMFDEVPQLVGEGTILCKEPPDPEPGPERTDVSDAFTVASYGDWEYDDVTDGFILDSSSGNVHMVNDHHNERGLLRRDEPVIHAAYTLGVSDTETLRDMDDGSPRRAKDEPRGMLSREQRQYKNAYVEEGQRTIEVLVHQPHVQLTVTSKMAGPAYIRFLDSNMQPFGTDVDEDPMWRGADVVGLDSQGRLALDKEVALNKAMALAYDQYIIKTPGVIPGVRPDNSYLVGAASQMNDDGEYIKGYDQGAFRFFNPCPEVGHHFYVEVYEANGKYLQTTEEIVCVPSPKPGPTGLEFKIDSQVAGEGVLTFEPALNAVGHTVLLIDASNRNIVESVTATASMFNADTGLYTVTFNERDNVGLNNGWTYHIVVIAEGAANQFTADAVRDYGVRWLGEDDVPLSTDSSDEPTRMHDLCMVENAEITALLSDCDTEPVPPAELGKPTNVMAVIDETDPGLNDIVVTWMDGANADVHHVYLVPTDFDFANIRQERITSGMTHTFMDVAPDTYIVAVQSTSPTTPGYEYAIAPGLITVGGQ